MPSYQSTRPDQPLLTGVAIPLAWSVIVLVLLAIVYSELPVFGFGWYGVLWMCIPPALIVGLTRSGIESYRWLRPAAILLGLIVMLWIATSPVFFNQAYHDVLGTPEEHGVTLPNLDLKKAGLVTEDMAMQSAMKLLSNQPGLGSQVRIGRLEKQLVDGNLVWVGFLEHSSFWRWYTNRTTPGYVVVSAHNPADARLVTGLQMRYLESAYFNSWIERFAWLKLPHKGLTDFTPELDDKGRPYWVASVYDWVVPFGLPDIVGTLVIDAQTGETRRYSTRGTPAWVDRIQPDNVVLYQVYRWGSLVHGYWNSMFSKRDVLHPSSRPDLVYGENGRAYWYIGLGSAGRDNGINGFLLVDSRTKQSVHYKIAGANESVAANAVLGLLPEKRYTSTTPLPFIVQGEPTYVTVLKDATGIARAFGMVAIRNYQNVAVGDTLELAARNYQARMSRTENPVTQAAPVKELRAVVARFAADIHSGTTTYFLKVKGRPELFVGQSDISDKLPLTAAGDAVVLTYRDGQSNTINMISFENESL